MNVRQLLVIGVPLVIIGGAVALKNFFAAQKTEPPKTPATAVIKTVEVKEVAYEKLNSQVVAFGRINSAQAINVVAEVGGKVMRGNNELKEAQTFSKGDVLYRIDDTEARLALQSQKSEFMNSLASILADIKIDYSDSYETWDNYIHKIEINKPLPELPEFKNKKEKLFFSNKRIVSSYYSIRSAEERLQRYVFRAPYTGSITELRVEENSVVNPGTQLMRIIRTDEMEAELSLKADEMKWINKGMELMVYNDNRNFSWKGKIVRIGDFIDPNTQSVSVYVSIQPNKNNKLYEGMYVMAEINGTRISDAMEIPRRALFNNNYVYTVVDGKLKQEQVNLVKLNAETAIINGLETGKKVVVESVPGASDNQTVKTR